MSDPVPYDNPEYKPFVGPYKWQPATEPSGNSTAHGFAFQHINPGRFRNDIPVGAVDGNDAEFSNPDTYTVEITTTGVVKEGDSKNPFLSAFRGVANPSLNLKVDAGAVFEINASSEGLIYKISIKRPVRISAIKLAYSLSYNPGDSDSKKAISHFIHNSDGNYPLMKVEGKDKSGAKVSTDQSELMTTFDSKTGRKQTRTVILKFGTGNIVSAYPFLNEINIYNRYPVASLDLTLEKIMLYDAEPVNLTEGQLPCKLIQYAYYTNFSYRPSVTDGVYFPKTSRSVIEPNFFVKLFSPDDLSGLVGFAHALNFRFEIFSAPVFGIAPFSTTLVGLMGDMANPSTFMTTVLGPMNSTRTAAYSFSSNIVQSDGARIVRLDKFPINSGTKTIALLKAKDYISSTAPTTNVEWTTLTLYPIDPAPSPSSPFIREFVYVDALANKNAWYKLVHSNRTNINEMFDWTSEPFQNEVFSEHATHGLTTVSSQSAPQESITRRVILDADPLKLDPVAIFIQDDSAYFDGSTTLRKGAWALSLRASTEDPNNLVSTHLFARFWFQPDNEPMDFSNIHKHREDTEFCFTFDTAKGQCVLKKGTPTEADLMMSGAISSNLSDIQLRKYMDEETSLSLFSGARLVVGIYSISYRNPEVTTSMLSNQSINCPTFSIIVDGQIETTMVQTLSSRFLTQRSSKYTKSYYDTSPKLYLTMDRVSTGLLIPDTGQMYAPYNAHYVAATKTTSVKNAFNNLLVLKEYTEESEVAYSKIYAPYSEVPIMRDNNVYVYQDFITYSNPFIDSLVAGNTKWQIKIKLADNSKQNEYINAEYRLQSFFATVDGIVVSRVFDTGFSSKSEAGVITFEPTINTSFLSGEGSNLQFVMRFLIYPYSKNGQVVDLSALAIEIGEPVGLKIDKFYVANSSIKRLVIDQVDSAIGSPAYYENLPITPNRGMGANEFMFIADPNIVGKTFITFVDMDFWVQGALYSPIWYVDFPDGMEVDFSAAEYQEDQLLWRTVPFAEGKVQLLSLAAVEDRISGIVTVINDDVPPETLKTSYDEVVRKRVLPFAYSRPSQNDIVKDSAGNILPGFNSNLNYVNDRYQQTAGKSTILSIITERVGTQYNVIGGVLDDTMGLNGPYSDPINEAKSLKNTSIKNFANNLSYPIILQPKHSTNVFVGGWRAPGILIGKYVNVWAASLDENESTGTYYLVDGDKSADIPNNIIKPMDESLNGAVVEGHCGGVYIHTGLVLMAYILENRNGVIMGRMSREFTNFGEGMELLSIPKMLGESTVDILVYAPVLAYNEILDIAYLAFYSGGKIFVTYLSGIRSGVIGLNPIQLVAGSRDFDSSDNMYNSVFKQLFNKGHLIKNQAGDIEDDVPDQRPGFIASVYDAGNLYIYYKDNNGLFRARQILNTGLIGNPVDIS